MKVGELREKLLSENSEERAVIFNNLAIRYTKGTDIDINFKDELIAYVSSTREEKETVEEAITFMGKTITNINGLIQIAQYLGIEVGEVKPVTLTDKQIESYESKINELNVRLASGDNENNIKLAKAEASLSVYERLTAREITIKA